MSRDEVVKDVFSYMRDNICLGGPELEELELQGICVSNIVCPICGGAGHYIARRPSTMDCYETVDMACYLCDGKGVYYDLLRDWE